MSDKETRHRPPQKMPVLVHTMPLSPNWLGRTDPFGGVNYGMQFETSHVTVQGLKVLGSPQSKRNYLHIVAGTPGSELAAGLFAA